MNVEPDGFIGAVIAAQSVEGIKAMVNGPGGCRSRSMNLLREMIQEYDGDEEGSCSCRYMSRVGLLPCTFLNADDIILGSGTKITDGLKSVIEKTGSDVAVIDTLCAGVQVVDREESVKNTGHRDKVIECSEELSEMTFTEGFDDTMVRILVHYLKDKLPKVPRSVNVLGYSIADRSWDYGKEQIESLLKMAGVEKVTFVSCRCSHTELLESPSSELDILIHPEYSIRTAQWLKDNFSIPFLIPSAGIPVGFDSIRSFIKEVAGFFGSDAGAAVGVINEEEQKVFRVIRNYDKYASRLKAEAFTINGLASDVLPIMKLVSDYFCSVPRSVGLVGTNRHYNDSRVGEYLASRGLSESFGADKDSYNPRIFIGAGYDADQYSVDHADCATVGILMPYPDTVPLTDRCLVGISGTRNILDQILNGIKTFICDQPTPADFR